MNNNEIWEQRLELLRRLSAARAIHPHMPETLLLVEQYAQFCDRIGNVIVKPEVEVEHE